MWLPQKERPQERQWWRYSVAEKGWLQVWHWVALLKAGGGTGGGCWCGLGASDKKSYWSSEEEVGEEGAEEDGGGGGEWGSSRL